MNKIIFKSNPHESMRARAAIEVERFKLRAAMQHQFLLWSPFVLLSAAITKLVSAPYYGTFQFGRRRVNDVHIAHHPSLYHRSIRSSSSDSKSKTSIAASTILLCISTKPLKFAQSYEYTQRTDDTRIHVYRVTKQINARRCRSENNPLQRWAVFVK